MPIKCVRLRRARLPPRGKRDDAEELEAEILAASSSVAASDPWEALHAGFEKLIDLCARPDVQRIIFIEAPQVIGPAAVFNLLRTRHEKA